MTIPLDRLYHFVENTAEQIHRDSVIIYRFYPHGSKNIEQLNYLNNTNNSWEKSIKFPHIWCNDQEPLNYEFYSKNLRNKDDSAFVKVLKSIDQYRGHTNLNFKENWL